MSSRELLQKFLNEIQTIPNITVTRIYDSKDTSVARLMIGLDNATQIVQIDVKELCVYRGLNDEARPLL